MAKFFVGQRVKLVNPKHICNLGSTGIIVELFPDTMSTWGSVINCDVAWDDRDDTFRSETNTDRLEPILDNYDGNTMTEWEELTNLIGFDPRTSTKQTERV